MPEKDVLDKFSSLGLASITEDLGISLLLFLNFDKSTDLIVWKIILANLLNWLLSSVNKKLKLLPSESKTNSQENEKVKDSEARKKITTKIREPTTPKIFERLTNTKEPSNPPDDDWGNKSPEK